MFISKSEKIANVSNLLWCVRYELDMNNILRCTCSTSEALKTEVLYGYFIGRYKC